MISVPGSRAGGGSHAGAGAGAGSRAGSRAGAGAGAGASSRAGARARAGAGAYQLKMLRGHTQLPSLFTRLSGCPCPCRSPYHAGALSHESQFLGDSLRIARDIANHCTNVIAISRPFPVRNSVVGNTPVLPMGRDLYHVFLSGQQISSLQSEDFSSPLLWVVGDCQLVCYGHPSLCVGLGSRDWR